MIDLQNNVIQIQGQKQEILRWEVWFLSPLGLHGTWKEAYDVCMQHDFDPRFTINPTPVAIGEGGLYESTR